MEWRGIKFHYHDVIFEDLVDIAASIVFKPDGGMHVRRMQAPDTDHE
jgi:hypothetical protein